MSMELSRAREIFDVEAVETVELRLERIELYVLKLGGIDNRIGEQDSSSWRCGLLRIRSGSIEGWGTCFISDGCERFDVVKWAAFLHGIKSLTLADACLEAERHRNGWGASRTELVLEALAHLTERKKRGYGVFGTDAGAVMNRAEAYYDVLF